MLRLSVIATAAVIMSLAIYAFALNTSLPWHPLQQIALSSSSTKSLDEDNNGRIDAGIIEDTLQDITNNGATTNKAITVGGLTSNGKLSVTDGSSTLTIKGNTITGAPTIDALNVIGSSTFNNKVIVNNDLIVNNNVGIGTNNPQAKLDVNGDIRFSSLLNCNGKLYTDTNGIVRCGTDQVNDADANPTNELQTLAQVLQRGNDAQGNSIIGLGSITTNQLCLSDGCKTAWSQVGGIKIGDTISSPSQTTCSYSGKTITLYPSELAIYSSKYAIKYSGSAYLYYYYNGVSCADGVSSSPQRCFVYAHCSRYYLGYFTACNCYTTESCSC